MKFKGKELHTGLFDELNVYPVSGRKGVKIAIVFPSTYQASITNLFVNIAYYYLNEELPNALVDRFTLDNPTEGALSALGLGSFDIILASITFELDLPAFIKILIKNGIPPLTRRRELGKHPLIIGGGPSIMANPLPYSAVMDVSFVGEGEILLKHLTDILGRIKRWRKDYLRGVFYEIRELKESYVLGKTEVIRGHVRSLESIYTPTMLIRSLKTPPIYGDGYYIEVSRGCKWLCPFCLEAYVSYPPRYRTLENLMCKVREGVRNLSSERTVLYSLSFFDHPKSDEILENLINEGISFSLPSIRYHTLTPERVELIAEGGQKTLTLAPETGIHEISNLVGKPLLPELLESLAIKALNKGMRLKFYFIMGLPGEGADAGLKAGNLIQKIIKSSKAGKGMIKVSVNPLVPKAWTPMQYCPMIGKREFKSKLKDLILSLKGLGVEINSYSWNWAYIQAAISLGNYNTGKGIAAWGISNESFSQLINYLRNYGFIDPLKPRSDKDISWDIVKDINEARVKSYGTLLCRRT